MSNILVTGGLGFIGSNFISKLIDRENFIVNVDSETYASVDKTFLNFESNQNYRHYNFDISDYQKVNEIIKKYSFDIIFILPPNLMLIIQLKVHLNFVILMLWVH